MLIFFKFTWFQIQDRLLPKVAIIGKQNVSKSVLFNGLVGVRQSSSLQYCVCNVGHHIMFKPECSNKLNSHVLQGNRAIIVDEPGVTRDRLYGRSYWGDQEIMVINTGGVIALSKSQASVIEEFAVMLSPLLCKNMVLRTKPSWAWGLCLTEGAHALVACLLAGAGVGGKLHARVDACSRVRVKIAFVHILIFLSSFINLLDWSQKVASCNHWLEW